MLPSHRAIEACIEPTSRLCIELTSSPASRHNSSSDKPSSSLVELCIEPLTILNCPDTIYHSLQLYVLPGRRRGLGGDGYDGGGQGSRNQMASVASRVFFAPQAQNFGILSHSKGNFNENLWNCKQQSKQQQQSQCMPSLNPPTPSHPWGGDSPSGPTGMMVTDGQGCEDVVHTYKNTPPSCSLKC